MASSAVSIDEAAAALQVAPPVLRRLAAGSGPLSFFTDPETGQEMVSQSAIRRFLGRRLEPHYSVDSAAALLDCSRATIYRHIRSGALRPRLLGGRRRIPESELLGLLTPAL